MATSRNKKRLGHDPLEDRRPCDLDELIRDTRGDAPKPLSPILQETPAQEGSSVFCRKCGARINEAAAFCEKCGAAQSINSEGHQVTAKASGRSGRRISIWLPLFIIVVLAFAGYMSFNNGWIPGFVPEAMQLHTYRVTFSGMDGYDANVNMKISTTNEDGSVSTKTYSASRKDRESLEMSVIEFGRRIIVSISFSGNEKEETSAKYRNIEATLYKDDEPVDTEYRRTDKGMITLLDEG